jgi:hypothetical protein
MNSLKPKDASASKRVPVILESLIKTSCERGLPEQSAGLTPRNSFGGVITLHPVMIIMRMILMVYIVNIIVGLFIQ